MLQHCLRGYDYSQFGAYFVTICTQNKKCFFGNIVNDEMVLNDSGGMVESVWSELPKRFSHVKLDEFVIMPNHFHGIVVFRRGESCIRHKTEEQTIKGRNIARHIGTNNAGI